jgi:hypothetical protein
VVSLLKNKFELRENVVVIYLEQKNGTIYETLVDIKHLQILNPLDVKWTAVRWTGTRGIYVQGTLSLGHGKYETLILHRILTNAPKGKIVDHINHDTLDNRSSNLRLVSKSQNNQNKSGLHSTNTSGIRGVSWNKDSNTWRVQTSYLGKKIYLGSFKELEEAKKCFEDFAEKFFMTDHDKPEEMKVATNTDVRDFSIKSKNGHRIGKSGIKHIHFHRQTGKWLVVINRVHYGIFDTIEESEKALKSVLKSHS